VAEAFFWGFVGGAALLLGAVIGLRATVPDRVLGLIMAFGAGVLISAASFDLTAQAFLTGGRDAAAGGLAAGALTFFLTNQLLNRRQAARGGAADPSLPLVVGAVLDGIPESAAIGISLLGGEGVSVAVVVAVFLSNVPESLSATAGMRGQRSNRFILGMWSVVVLASASAAAIGNGILGGAGDNLLAFINAFAAGAILTMLADSMIPEAFERERRSLVTGLVTTLGFSLAALLTTLE
jgi:zinc transporter, ZIP family